MLNISYTLTPDDFRQLDRMFAKRVKRGAVQIGWASNRRRWLAIATASCYVLTLLAVLLSGKYGWIENSTAHFSSLSLIGGFAAGAGLTFLFVTGSQIEPVRPQGPLMGFTQLTATDEGISVQRPHMRTEYEWAAIEAASAEDAYVVLWLEPCLTELIPYRAFSTSQEHAAFYDFVISRLSDRT